jgi:hypothetical protein
MKNLRQFCALIVLTVAFTLSAFAGEIHIPVADPPPAPPSAPAGGDISTMVAGDMHTGITTTDAATEITLSFLQGVMSLF